MRKIFTVAFKIVSIIALCITLFVIVGIFCFLFIKGLSHVSLSFIFESPSGQILGSTGGIFPSIVGSFYFVSLALVFAFPLALATAVVVEFFIHNSAVRVVIQTIMQLLSGVPSILLGLFSYSIFVKELGFGRCIFSASVALAIMVLPFIEIRLEKSFWEIGKKYFQNSISLGCSKIYTVMHLIFPILSGEIISTLVLAFCFAIGATAPIMFTGGVAFSKIPTSIFSPAMALPLHLYLLVQQGGLQIDIAYATATVMITIVFACNLCVNIYSIRKKIKWQTF